MSVIDMYKRRNSIARMLWQDRVGRARHVAVWGFSSLKIWKSLQPFAARDLYLLMIHIAEEQTGDGNAVKCLSSFADLDLCKFVAEQTKGNLLQTRLDVPL